MSIRLLGPPRIEVRGVPLAVDTRKAVALLAHLAVTARPASREALAALLWPESGDHEARGALRRTLSVLNAAVGGVGLAIDRTAVALVPEGIDVDVRSFRDALARARDHRHAPDVACAACLAALDEAAALDRGEFMAGFALRDSEVFDDWQRAEAEAHRRDLAGALERLARGRLAEGAWQPALVAGRRWLEIDPLHEPAQRLVMTTLSRAGEEAAAVRQYRECVRILDAELGVAPLAETTELYEAIRAGRLDADGPPRTDAPRPAHEPGSDAGPLPLVGRGPEIDALRLALDAIGPDGRVLVIEGEPGIGKTRLATEVAATIRAAGGVMLEARAYAGEGSIAFGPIGDLLRAGLSRPGAADRLEAIAPALLAEVARLMPLPGVTPSSGGTPDPFGRTRLLEGLAEVITALVAGPVPGLVALDDIHLADASTAEAIAYLARRLAGRPIALVVTWRPEDLSDMDARRIVGPLVAAASCRIRLGRLDRAAVADLASARLGGAATEALVDRLYADSEGLPLYVAAALDRPPDEIGAIPGDVRALLRSRIELVDEVAVQVLAAAAVIGRSFDLEIVRIASGRSEDETVAGLEELGRRGLIREAATGDVDVGYDFTHAGLREVAYDSLGLARRRLLHRRVAEALGSAGLVARSGGTSWSAIAHHETLAGRSAVAADAHRRAGEHARSVFANAEARAHLEAALALDHPEPAELHEALGDVCTLLGDYRAAIVHLESAAAVAGPARQAPLEHRLGLVHARRGDWERADSHLRAALAAAEPIDAVGRSAILADRSAVAHHLGATNAAERLAAEAIAVAEAALDPAGVARASDILGIIGRARRDLVGAAVHLERALAAADQAQDASLRIATRNTLALVCADAGDHGRAIALTREALVLCERLGDRHRQAALENNLADLLQGAGRRDEALDHLKRAVAIFADVGGRPGELEPEIWKLIEW